ncbi:MAG: hypothetical protein ACK4OK_06010, partial [Thermoflexus sp.]
AFLIARMILRHYLHAWITTNTDPPTDIGQAFRPPSDFPAHSTSAGRSPQRAGPPSCHKWEAPPP